jgi:hypothetical protein
MTIERARELARMYFDEALNRGNLAVVDEILDPAFTLHVPPSRRGSAGHWAGRVQAAGDGTARGVCRPALHRARHDGR